MNWQPIETAPRDKAVLVATDYGVTIGWYRNFAGPKASKWQTWARVINPTHWMPLPKHPTETTP